MKMDTYRQWLGREQSMNDVATAAPPRLLAATLNREVLEFREGDVLPPAWHWLYFLTAVRTREVGADGHPPRGDFLPDVPLPRRMRAGGDFRFERPIRIGEALEQRSRIASITEKTGSSGPLVFVRVEHEIHADGSRAVLEGEDIVYRGANASPRVAQSGTGSPPVVKEDESVFATDPVLLFRVSALTFNGHRIHYDAEYATAEEGYPGRVVHGPLIALLMLEHMRKSQPESALRSFKYRAMAPTFCGDKVYIDSTGTGEPSEQRIVARNGSGATAVVGNCTHADHR
jgi:3-methylfumaryl-CoA hydratase